MECAAHPGAKATESCSSCKRGLCGDCVTYEIDGRVACSACADAEDARARSLGSALLALVGVGYLATLALSVVVFRARPFVGGLAAVVAIALGRGLQLVLRPSVVARRHARPDASDAEDAGAQPASPDAA